MNTEMAKARITTKAEIKARDKAAEEEYQQTLKDGGSIKDAERAAARVYLAWEI